MTDFSSSKGDLTTGSVGRHLVRLTIPMIWGILSIISFQLVNTYYVSLLGTAPLAAISFTFPVTYSIFSIFMGFSIATSSVVSRLIGEKATEDIRRVTTHGLLLVGGISFVAAAAGLIFLDPLFRAMGADEVMLPLIADYMRIYFLGSVFICMPMVGNAALRAAGDTRTPATIMASAAIANAVIDPFLIFGLCGLPRLELQGAAISTVIANFGALIAGLITLYRRKMFCWFYAGNFAALTDSARRLLFIALPAGITSALPAVVNAFIIFMLAKHSNEAVAAFGVVTRIEAFVFIVMMALSIGMAPIIGQNWGAGRHDRIRETLKLALYFCAAWSALVALILWSFSNPLAALFSKDSLVRSVMVLYFVTVPLSYPLANLVSGWGSAYNAMGKPYYAAGMLFTKLIALTIPATWIGFRVGDIEGLFVALCLVNLTTGFAFHTVSWIACDHRARNQPRFP